MNVFWLICIAIAVALLIWFVLALALRRHTPGRSLTAIEPPLGLDPVKVTLPEDMETDEERDRRKRSGATQKLERVVVRGPYRPVDERGEPSAVEPMTKK